MPNGLNLISWACAASWPSGFNRWHVFLAAERKGEAYFIQYDGAVFLNAVDINLLLTPFVESLIFEEELRIRGLGRYLFRSTGS
jgi:hypothetical protein